MLDIQRIRENPEEIKEGIKSKGVNPELVGRFLDVDEEWRKSRKELDDLRAELNALSKARNIEKAREVKEIIKDKEIKISELEKKRDALLLAFPNIPFPEWPVGKDESDNVVIREVGRKPNFTFQPKDYLTIAENLGIIDIERAARVAGSRFGYLFGAAALLEMALIQYTFSKLIKKGFIAAIPPVMIRPEIMRGMGKTKFLEEKDAFFVNEDNLYLVGSAEHTLGPIHMNEVINEKDLPRRYLGFSTCFRREAGSYGKDTKGILRVHQFDKIEMFSFSAPDKSKAEHEFFLAQQEELMKGLELPYRVVQICTSDMTWGDAAQYDIETWLPGQGNYRETHSTSNATDFQARGINARYNAGDGTKKYVHTLNGTAFATGRIIIAILENYQTAQGTVRIPKALTKYMGLKEIK